MRQAWDSHLAGRLVVLFVVILLLGVAPRPHRLTRLLWQAQQARESHSYLAAAQRLAQAAEMIPWRSDLCEEAGRLALQGEDPAQAIVYLEKCASSDRLSQEGQMTLASAYRQTRNLPAAIQIWEKLLLQTGPTPELLTHLYQAHQSLGDYPAAIETLRALSSLQPADASLRYQTGLFLAAQEPEKALGPLVQAAELDPSLAPRVQVLTAGIRSALRNDEPAFRLVESGRALAAVAEWEFAAEAFHQATQANPDYAEAWAFLGEARQHQVGDEGDPNGSAHDQATWSSPASSDGLEELNKAIALNPNSLAANSFMALYWQRRQDYDQALIYLKKALKLEPQNPSLAVELGSTLALLGDLPGALQAYQSAVALAPKEPTYLKLLILFSIKYEYRLETIGLPSASQAVIDDPRDPEALDLLGQVLFRLEDLLQAEKFFQRAVEIDEKFAPAHLHLGMLYLEQGKRESALQHIRLAASLDPDTPAAEQARRLLETYLP